MTLGSGQKVKLAELTSSRKLTVRVRFEHPDVDLSVFGLSGERRLEDDRYFVFFNQPRSPNAEIERVMDGSSAVFTLDLTALPSTVTRLMFAATSDSQPLSVMRGGEVRLDAAGATLATCSLAGVVRGAEQAVMLLEVYLHAGEWRVAAVGQGFDGGLKALLEYFGGEVTPDAQPPAQPAPVSLVKQQQAAVLERAGRQQPALVNLIKQAAVSLEKRGLGDARYRVKLVLDVSASMIDQFKSGAVHDLVQRALALAARLDDDGSVEVYLFGIKCRRVGSVSLENADRFVRELRFDFEGGTHYGPVMTLVRDDARREVSDFPVLVLFVTDGGTSNPAAVIKQMREASNEALFWKFMGIEEGRVNFEFLEKLDDLSGRVVDNADFFRVSSPIRVPDAELFECLVNELDGWERAARSAGILKR